MIVTREGRKEGKSVVQFITASLKTTISDTIVAVQTVAEFFRGCEALETFRSLRSSRHLLSVQNYPCVPEQKPLG